MNVKTISTKTNHHKHPNHHRRPPLFSVQRIMRLSIILLLVSCVFLFVLFEIRFLKTPLTITSQTSLLSAWDFIPGQLRNLNAFATDANCSTTRGEADNDRLRQAVTFLPLIDWRYRKNPEVGNTWFMSSLSDKGEEGEVQYQEFPSEASNGRLLCIKGRHTRDGSWNSYALAWPESLPYNATLMKGLTLISNNHYGHEEMWYNTWHGVTQMTPFVAWHIKNGCTTRAPRPRFVLYHRGELRTKMGTWITALMGATFGGPLDIEGFDFLGGDDGGGGDQAVCFEEAVVFRKNEKLMSLERRREVFDLIRCKTREYCNVSSAAVEGGGGVGGGIGMTLLFRTGARSFKNETAVVGIFDKECKKVKGCQLRVAHSDNLTICEQVKLMSVTDIVFSPHGAQLANMILMQRNSTVMEIFPKGWLELGGVSQYVLHWLANWSGMNHPGIWRDSEGDPVPYKYPDNYHFMTVYKNAQIGHNETYLSAWARDVLNDMKQRKLVEGKEKGRGGSEYASGCACSSAAEL